MALFCLSDIIIAATLVANALALLASPLPPTNASGLKESAAGVEAPQSSANGTVIKDDNNVTGGEEEAQALLSSSAVIPGITAAQQTGGGVKGKIMRWLARMRKYSGVIVLWNVVFCVLMVLVFGE
jgi:hypothetical protein